MNQTSLAARGSEEDWTGFLAAVGTLITTVTHGMGGGRGGGGLGPEGSEALKHRPRSGLAVTSLPRAAGQQPGGDALFAELQGSEIWKTDTHKDAKTC